MTPFIPFCALMNMFRGRSTFSGGRWLACGVTGLLAGMTAASFGQPFWYVTFVVSFGLAFWAVWPWGPYFSAFHGRYDNRKAVEWIDLAGVRLYPLDGTAVTNRHRGLFQMSLRGLYLYPLFLWLTPVDPYAPLLGLNCMLQGPIYGAMRWVRHERYAVIIAEALFGLAYGALIYLCISHV